MIHELESFGQAWALVLRMFAWMSTHTILGGVTFTELMIGCVCWEILFWVIERLLPGLSGREKEDFVDNPFGNIRSEDDSYYTYEGKDYYLHDITKKLHNSRRAEQWE